VQFHIPRPLELLVDKLVHTAAGINEAGGDDGQAAAFKGIAGGAEEVLGRVEGGGVNAPRQSPAAGGHDQVIRAGEAGNAVK